MKKSFNLNKMSDPELREIIKNATAELESRNMVTDTMKNSADIALKELRKILSELKEDFSLVLSTEPDLLEIKPSDEVVISIVNSDGRDCIIAVEEEG